MDLYIHVLSRSALSCVEQAGTPDKACGMNLPVEHCFLLLCFLDQFLMVPNLDLWRGGTFGSVPFCVVFLLLRLLTVLHHWLCDCSLFYVFLLYWGFGH